jgi:ribosomal protein L29
MSISKYKDLEYLNSLDDIDEELLATQKKLFELKLKISVKEESKFHLVKSIRRRIAQLKYKHSLIKKNKN